MLVVVPHPDDETLGAGGLIATQRRRGVDVMVVCVTDGENAYPEEPEGAAAMGTQRSSEQQEALERLGVEPASMVRLGLTDSDVCAREGELAARVTELGGPGVVIVAPWEGDFHPDHEASGRAARAAAERSGAQLISYFFWTWHRGTPECLDGLRLVRFALDEDAVRARAEALTAHASQLERAGGEPVLPERLLAPARRNYEVFALR